MEVDVRSKIMEGVCERIFGERMLPQHVDVVDFVEFLVYVGVLEEGFTHWDSLGVEYDDWLSK